jgi:hypothetical protein
MDTLPSQPDAITEIAALLVEQAEASLAIPSTDNQ